MKDNIRSKHKQLYSIVLISIICFVLTLAGCTAKDISAGDNRIDIARNYIVNMRSGKIHSASCQYVGQMSEKNKFTTTDTLTNLLKDGYVICRKCRAGISKTIGEDIQDRIFHPNLYVENIDVVANYENYIEAIDDMSDWYVNHVPTYRKTLQQESLANYSGELSNYRDFELRHGTSKDVYHVLTGDAESKSTTELAANDTVLCANENAASYYRDEYDRIKFKRYLAYYPCDLIDSTSDYNMPGDDCMRFMFAIFNRMDSKFTSKYKVLSNVKYDNTNTNKFVSDRRDIVYGMINLGFKVFDVEEGPIMIDNDALPEGYILKIDDKFELKKGDILVTDGHVHFYMGNGVALEAENIGWGKVNRIYPQIYDINVENAGNGKTVVKVVNNSGDASYYTRVYRYIGEEAE